MSRKRREFEFKIDAYTLENLPMSRLAEYMTDLANMFGEQKSVHFVKLTKGSVGVNVAVEYEAEPKILQRVRSIRSGDAPIEAMRAARSIDRRLAEDNGYGVILAPEGKKIIEFPGRKRIADPQFGPFNQPGFIDGIPIRVGGQDDPVPIHLEELGQPPHICYGSRVIAQQIAPHIFSTMIRAHGVGRFHRDTNGKWTQDRFTIHEFKVLKVIPLTEIVTRLHSIPGGIGDVKNPLALLDEIRHGKKPRKKVAG